MQREKEKAELSQSPEGQGELEHQEQEELLREHRATLKRLQTGFKPTLGFARSTREQAAKALGLSGLARFVVLIHMSSSH